jgi:hypothetical protein
MCCECNSAKSFYILLPSCGGLPLRELREFKLSVKEPIREIPLAGRSMEHSWNDNSQREIKTLRRKVALCPFSNTNDTVPQ